MNKKLFKLLAITACSVTFATTLGLGVASSVGALDTAKAYEVTFSRDWQSEYDFGSTFTVPMGTIEGVQANRFMVIAPNGNAYSSEKIELTEAGRYTVKWFATVGGKEVSAEKYFVVKEDAFTLAGRSTCDYMEDLSLYEGHDGLKLSLANQATFRYNKVVDLRKEGDFIHLFPYHRIANLEQYRVGSGVKPEDPKYVEDARNYYVTLTDCYDSSRSVTIDIEWQDGRTYYNIKAGAPGQVSHGLRQNSTSSTELVNLDGIVYSIMYAPAQGMTQFNEVVNKGIKFSYDVEKNQLRSTYYRYYDGKSTLYKDNGIIADLDDTTINPENPFVGFTTGEVYVSISASNLINNMANVEVASIGGVAGKALLDAVTDDIAPTIRVNEGFAAMNDIALNETITIPEADVFDFTIPAGQKASKAVYYNYDPNKADNTLVGIVGGKFTPKKAGKYTVVYSAVDGCGNEAQATVELNCQAVTGGKAVNLSVPQVTEINAGEYASVPECTVSGLYTDASKIKTYLTNDKGEQVLYTDSEIFLDSVKEYEFTYVYETLYSTYTVTSVIKAMANDNVTFSNVTLPGYFIKNAKYTIDPVYAQEYKAVKTEPQVTTVYMKQDGGEYVKVNTKEVLITANSTVQFKYEYGTGATESAPIKVVDIGFGGELKMEKIFHTETDAVTSVATKNSVQYNVKASTEEATLDYVNVLSLSAFDIEFSFLAKDKETNKTYQQPRSVSFIFTDYYDRTKSATFTLRPRPGAGVFIDVNGVQKVGAIADLVFLGSRVYLQYVNGGVQFSGTTYNLNTDFTSDKVLLSISILDTSKGEVCMEVSRFCDNMLTNTKVDETYPSINISESHTGYQPTGRVINVVVATASSVIAPYLEKGLTLKVMKPDGSFAKSEDGVLLDGTCPVDR
ncbi:MAG: hypothetical protein IKA72_03555, partial [Clostridia bacterium]|nr:hypothetical protein [Clostridia bacterium]